MNLVLAEAVVVSIYPHIFLSIILSSYHLSIYLGFDEYMNLVLDEAVEVHVKRHTRKPLKRIMLKEK